MALEKLGLWIRSFVISGSFHGRSGVVVINFSDESVPFEYGVQLLVTDPHTLVRMVRAVHRRHRLLWVVVVGLSGTPWPLDIRTTFLARANRASGRQVVLRDDCFHLQRFARRLNVTVLDRYDAAV